MRTRLLLLGVVALVAAVAVSETHSTPPPLEVATIHVATVAPVVNMSIVSPATLAVSVASATPAPRSENPRSSEQVPEVRPTVGAQRAIRRLTLTHLDYRPARYAGTMEGWGFL